MNNLTKIILIRHGQSIGNLTRKFLGHTDLDLSDLGYKQAESTANALKNEKIDLIFSSDLIRAANTALPHAKIRNINVNLNPNLREAHAGEWEGLYVDEIIEKWGIDFFKNKWKDNFGLFAFPGGEGIIEAGRRFYNEIEDICCKNPGKTILIASHAAVIRSFWSLITNTEPSDIAESVPFPTNASYSICYYENGKFTPFEYSNDGHLIDVGITKVNLI